MAILGAAAGAVQFGVAVNTQEVSGSSPTSGYTMPENGTLLKLTMKIEGPTDGTQPCRGIIFNDSGGNPVSLFGVSSEITAAQGVTQEYDFTGFSNLNLIAGNKYWLGVMVGTHTASDDMSPVGASPIGNGTTRVMNTTGAGGYASGPYDPWLSGGSPVNVDGQMWVYLTYAPLGDVVRVVPALRSNLSGF